MKWLEALAAALLIYAAGIAVAIWALSQDDGRQIVMVQTGGMRE